MLKERISKWQVEEKANMVLAHLAGDIYWIGLFEKNQGRVFDKDLLDKENQGHGFDKDLLDQENLFNLTISV